MTFSTSVVCGFLGGTIFSVEGGYRVLQHPRPDRVFERIADARWFLAVNWCDRSPNPAGILTHDGTLSFGNQCVQVVGETEFLPLAERSNVFKVGLSAKPGKPAIYTICKFSDRHHHQVNIMSLEIDSRYGKVAIIQALNMDLLSKQSPF
jgi:hypothetical protein